MSSPPQGGLKLACLSCRHRKVACDRKRPRCSLCSKNDFECEYKSRQNRPGLRAGYVARLEQQIVTMDDRLRKVESRLESMDRSPGNPERIESTRHENLESQSDLAFDSLHTQPSFTPFAEDHSPYQAFEGPGSQSGHQYTPTSASAVESESMTLSDNVDAYLFSRCGSLWFKRYHPWFPILHRHSLERHAKPAASASHQYHHVWKAIAAVTLLDDENSTERERRISEKMCSEVLHYGMSVTSVRSLQALLVLSNHFHATGELTQFWNILAICHRICLHLELDVLASTGQTPSRQRHGYLSASDVDREEAIRAYWMTAMLESISTLGLSSCLASLSIPLRATLPCPESTWALQHPIIEDLTSRQVHYPSTFALCIGLAMEELNVIHKLSRRSYNMHSSEERSERQTEAQHIDERLTNWREEFVAAVFQLLNSEKSHLPRGEMEPLITLTNCVLNLAIIVLMQPMAPFPVEIERSSEPWPYATNRCVYACENMAAKVRRIAEDQLNSQSPHLLLPVFAAARFYIVYSKALEADVPANLRSLAYFLYSAGKHSLLAHRYEVIIRTAVAEHRSPLGQCMLPVEFYNLQLSTLEIVGILQEAADRISPWDGGPGSEGRSSAMWS